ncbi:hypothetical protein LCGC14_1518040 [marine sediment metagenome]|uniref:Uroporphyrinogen decarboxylase (URO-D) domain-containing protein n=1 Tax=marine sediment metagenome TaxID=412755 RepID=A0A0F9LF59_9ZZZZ
MTLRERILAVYRGEAPDVVPYMLDLSHWFYHKNRLPWDLSKTYEEPERDLIDYHKEHGVGFYMPNLASFYSAIHPGDVAVETEMGESDGHPEIAWRVTTPLGEIERKRKWQDQTYAWGISKWGITGPDELRVLAYSMANRVFRPKWENYRAWADCVGDYGTVYLSLGYSAMGYLLNCWMGVEAVAFAIVDYPEVLREAVDSINANILRLADLLAESPAEVILMGDNFSGDVQSPRFFEEWSREFYVAAIRKLHAAGKHVAVHIDGRLRGAISMIREAGADCGDAITPTPMGDLTPAQCRDEAGDRFILSGGVSPELWLPNAPLATFEEKVIEWLELKKMSPGLIANAGDQVPPGAEEERIDVMRDLVEEHGRRGT